MQFTQSIERYRNISKSFFGWRDALSVTHRLEFALAFACLTGLSAQIRIPLPFTPVPVTGQVLAVLLSGIVLGSLYGGLSQVFYLVFGTIGLPWFSGGIGGLAVITGVTGGYIIGFVPAALLIGWLTDKYNSARKFHFQLILMTSGIGLIYILGAIQFSLVMNTGLIDTIKLSVIPFIPVDLIKAVLAAGLSASILKK
ncbi:biotin transporter BioY [Candidatus Poribacteria bacterium]|nr:biotin transporter BioY [Candidatus Poribacteria bacterium]